ncbi:hypothetical protein CUJ83_13000 [Methanocella sp. CWC-04]|uniref:Uncharacterized protein n=1 Tax=Methanooceanicella nereidis TaxID=2052831 RepID=A0AAP2REM7_9EURY|nr:hypothetical protein [Methanocella sp. CWC-04]MCD1295913.1 hypothetical protein [Methanocella sp. CWC-04]
MDLPGFNIVLIILTIICLITMMVFLFFISRFYELKFRQSTYYLIYLMPGLAFIALLLFALITGGDILQWVALITNLLSLMVLSTFGFLLYSKMMGVSR